MKPRGRHWVLFWLAVFLAVATAVVARQRAALDTAARVRRLRDTRAALEARRAELERVIRTRTTSAELLPKVQDLGLGLPADTALTILSVRRPAGDREP